MGTVLTDLLHLAPARAEPLENYLVEFVNKVSANPMTFQTRFL
jgi:hypothetical protein